MIKKSPKTCQSWRGNYAVTLWPSTELHTACSCCWLWQWMGHDAACINYPHQKDTQPTAAIPLECLRQPRAELLSVMFKQRHRWSRTGSCINLTKSLNDSTRHVEQDIALNCEPPTLPQRQKMVSWENPERKGHLYYRWVLSFCR